MTTTSLLLPLSSQAIALADRFAQEQISPTKAEQVRRNTLAVCAVHSYLTLMNIPTDVRQSDSWNPMTRLLGDVADLVIPGVGRIECRAVNSGDRTCTIPPEVWNGPTDDEEFDSELPCIGYAIVRLDAAQFQAEMIGFVPVVNQRTLSLDQLQPIEALLQRIDGLMRPSVTETIVATLSQQLTRLGAWFDDRIDAGWQELQALTFAPEIAWRYRDASVRPSQIRRAKVVPLPGNQSIALVITTLRMNHQLVIQTQLAPLAPRIHLPPQIQLQILDADGQEHLTARSRDRDTILQLQLDGQPGESFSVQISGSDFTYTEHFEI